MVIVVFVVSNLPPILILGKPKPLKDQKMTENVCTCACVCVCVCNICMHVYVFAYGGIYRGQRLMSKFLSLTQLPLHCF